MPSVSNFIYTPIHQIGYKTFSEGVSPADIRTLTRIVAGSARDIYNTFYRIITSHGLTQSNAFVMAMTKRSYKYDDKDRSGLEYNHVVIIHECPTALKDYLLSHPGELFQPVYGRSPDEKIEELLDYASSEPERDAEETFRTLFITEALVQSLIEKLPSVEPARNSVNDALSIPSSARPLEKSVTNNSAQQNFIMGLLMCSLFLQLLTGWGLLYCFRENKRLHQNTYSQIQSGEDKKKSEMSLKKKEQEVEQLHIEFRKLTDQNTTIMNSLIDLQQKVDLQGKKVDDLQRELMLLKNLVRGISTTKPAISPNSSIHQDGSVKGGAMPNATSKATESHPLSTSGSILSK